MSNAQVIQKKKEKEKKEQNTPKKEDKAPLFHTRAYTLNMQQALSKKEKSI